MFEGLSALLIIPRATNITGNKAAILNIKVEMVRFELKSNKDALFCDSFKINLVLAFKCLKNFEIYIFKAFSSLSFLL